MVHIPTQHLCSHLHSGRSIMGNHHQLQTMLEQHRIRGTKPDQMRGTLQMTKCMCEQITDPLVMTRELLADTVRFNRNNQRLETLDEIVDLLNKHRQLWFSQSLTAVTQTYWKNKIQTIDLLLVEIEEMKCQ